MFDAVGLSAVELAKEGIQKTRALMNAEKKKTVVTREGEVVESSSPDNAVQLGASRQALEVADAFSSRSAGGSGKASVHIELVLPEWSRIKDIQVEPED